jgi:hypothetical protein
MPILPMNNSISEESRNFFRLVYTWMFDGGLDFQRGGCFYIYGLDCL